MGIYAIWLVLLVYVFSWKCGHGQYASPVGGNPAALEPPQGYQQPPVVGAPYALPEMSESPKDVIVPSQETLDLDKVQTTSTVTPVPPATNATAAAAGGETGNQCHVAAHSIDDVKTLAAKPKRLRLETEQRSLTKLREDIAKLQADLKDAREETKKSQMEREKTGRPDALSLSFEFPSRKTLNRKVEEVTPSPLMENQTQPLSAANTTSSSNTTASGATHELTPLTMKLMPIPIIYASEDGRSLLAEAVKNAEEVVKEEALFNEKETAGMVSSKQNGATQQEIESIQRKLDKLAAASSYYKTDADLVSQELKTKASLAT